MKKIAVIGAGWYGCYAAYRLTLMGQNVNIFESNDILFSGASGKNQNRLHLGFHYPRCYETRKQSRIGFEKFINNFASLTSTVNNNIYAVPVSGSRVSFEDYIKIYAAEEYNFSKVNIPIELDKEAISGAISVTEMLIDTSRAKIFWERKLRSMDVSIFFNTKVTKEQFYTKNINGSKYDIVIDCTWLNLLDGEYDVNVFYEQCIYFEIKAKTNLSFGALTLMDGNFFSIYPTSIHNVFTFTSVKQTPMLKGFDGFNDFDGRSVDFLSIYESFLQEAKKYYPRIEDDFIYHNSKLVQKTKPVSSLDSRSTIIERYGDDRFSIMSGKIDTIFEIDPLLEEISRE